MPRPLFSTMTGLPQVCVSSAARTRTSASVVEPGGAGTTIVTSRDGKASCAEPGVAPAVARTTAARARTNRRVIILSFGASRERRALLHLDIGRLDDLAPKLGLLGEELAGLRGRGRHRLHLDRAHLLDHFGAS